MDPVLVPRSARAGFTAPLYVRDEDETYRVVAGRVTFFVDGQVVEAGEGDTVVAPAGASRTFVATSDDARWLVLTRVASLDRYLDFCRAVARPSAAGWPSAEELAGVTAIAAANGIELLGPPGMLPAALSMAA